LLHLPGQTLIATASDDQGKAAALRDAGAEVLFIGTGGRSIDLSALLQQLAAREINELHVEAGATLCGALLHAGLVDELVLYMAPHIMGSRARGLFNLPALETMAERVDLEVTDTRAVGDDWRITALIKNK
jgi:diaminohydroxyphosphoribosylaminopyrimidine deaminase/5-amino-6-(5-phosphoribosylamino)uracil reductase